MFYQKEQVRFQCSGCGRCCFGHPDEHYIELAAGEAKLIRQTLALDKKTFKRDYLVKLAGIGEGLKINAQGRCVLLDENLQCSIYKVRPRQCQTYPFWPELMHSAEAWHAEAERCEGVNQGNAVSRAVIEKALK